MYFLYFRQVGGEEFLCNASLSVDDGKQVVEVSINGTREQYSFVTKDEEIHIFTKVKIEAY